jgi:hypothetical protein
MIDLSLLTNKKLPLIEAKKQPKAEAASESSDLEALLI